MKNRNFLRQLVLAFILLIPVVVHADSNSLDNKKAVINNYATSIPTDTLMNIVQWPVSEGGNDHWYGIVPIVQDWYDHIALVETLELNADSGYLVTITSSAENQFIEDNILAGNTEQPSITDEFYLGGSTTDGWLTGEAMTYTNWSVGEPNGDGIAMAIWGASQGSKSGTWNDVSPDDVVGEIHRLWAIVEFGTPSVVPVDTLINIVQWPVSEGGNDHWYGIVPIVQDWYDHRDLVETLELNADSGYLVTITSAEENQFIEDYILTGNTEQPSITDEFYLGGSTTDGWLTGEAMTYTNWSVGEPNGDGIAMAIWGASQGSNSGTWNDVPPDDVVGEIHRLWAIVEFGTPSVVPVDTLINIVQWPVSEGGNDHWYGVLAVEHFWEDADAIANTFEHNNELGHLATVASQEENDFILANVILDIPEPHIGIVNQSWIGGNDEYANGTWGWVTNEPFQYTNWSAGEPTNPGIETGLAMKGNNDTYPGEWNNALQNDSIHNLHQYWSIVEFGIDSVSGGGDPTDTLINIVQWPVSEGGNDHWYGIVPIVQNWDDHRALSETIMYNGEYGHLVTISTANENQFVFDNILVGNTDQPSITDEFYIGGTTTDGWLTGEAMDYTNWASGEPSGDGFAMAIWGASQGFKSGNWNDVPNNGSPGSIHRLWSIVEFGVDDSTGEDPLSGAITLDNVIGSPNPGEIYANTDVKFQLRVNNNTGLEIAGISNGFRVYTSDALFWGSTTGDTIGSIGMSMFDLVFAINTFSSTGQRADSVYFGGASLHAGGLPIGYNEVAYEISIHPLPESSVGKTICLDSAFTPPTGTWKWAATSASFFPSWDGPHCFTIVPENNPNSGAFTLDNVIGSPNPGEIYANTDVKFQLRVENNIGIEIDGISNGFEVYSPDGAEWGTTIGDTIGSIGHSMFDILFVINSFSVTGSSADSLLFGGVSLTSDGLPIGYNEVAYEIGIGPIHESHIGKTICIDSAQASPTGNWKWAVTSLFTYFPTWDGPHCFTIVPGVVISSADSLIIPSVDVHFGMNTLTVASKLEQPIKGATIPLSIPAGIDVIELNTNGLVTESWDFNILQIKPDSGFILVALANSFGAEIPVGTTDLFNIVFKGTNTSCEAPLQINIDTVLSADVSRRLTFVSSSNASIHPGFDKYRDDLLIAPLVMGDINNSGAVDISDLVALIDFIFLGGDDPEHMIATDVNADCQGPDISDIVALIDFIFISNDPLSCGCLGTLAKREIETNHEINITSEYINGQTIISVNTPIALKGIELYIENNSNGLLEKLPQNELNLYYHTDNKITKAGLFDSKGLLSIQSGKTQLLSLDGDCRIVSVVVADENSNSIIPSINNKVSLLPSQFSLLQNYPNPFNPTTNIEFGLPVGSQVKLSIFNIQGQMITTVADGYFEAGQHSVIWDGENFSSGIYLYRLETDSFVSTKKMMLLK